VPRLNTMLRTLGVLLACLGLASVSLAATGGGAGKNPGAAVVAAARAHLGDAYAWAGSGPDAFDCSGLTSTLWREVGGVKGVPRTSRLQHAWAVPLPAEQVLPGDLVFFGDPVTHVGIVASRTRGNAGTSVQMIDASSSQKGVVTRKVWSSGTVRFGRVPRKGMVRVTPWTAPEPAPPRAPRTPTGPISKPTSKPVAKPVTARPAAAPRTTADRAPLQGLPGTQAGRSSAVALRAVALAKKAVGQTTWTDVELVRSVWKRAGGATHPSTRRGLNAAARPVALKDARVGDLVVYGPPADHVGIYVGRGLMVDASRSLGKVVLRPVWASPSVQLLRLAR
jgi:cell wall-associated NlpC family hydrolase